jgi:hypothetical protein
MLQTEQDPYVVVAAVAANGDTSEVTTCAEENDDEFCDMLLAAMVAMALKSKRRQADISAVMVRHRLVAPRERIGAALRKLEMAAQVRDIVPLYDGGTLVTVTNTGMDLLGGSKQWRFLQETEAAA